jgi:hypothetical protein
MVAMKNAVFWDIETQFVPHRRHITSPLQGPADYCYVRFEVFNEIDLLILPSSNQAFWVVQQIV